MNIKYLNWIEHQCMMGSMKAVVLEGKFIKICKIANNSIVKMGWFEINNFQLYKNALQNICLEKCRLWHVMVICSCSDPMSSLLWSHSNNNSIGNNILERERVSITWEV